MNIYSPWQPVKRNYRIEWPHRQGIPDPVIFADREEALKAAKKWALEDSALVLVWDFGATMYIGRFDGRGDAGECDGCGELSHTLKTVDGDNPYKVRDLCIVCRCSDPGY